MTNKTVETIAIALKNMNPRAKKLIIVPDGFAYPNGNINTIVLQHNFNIEDAIIAIANIKYIGIINAELFNRTKLSELINILTNTNKSTVIRLNASPVSCKIFYPSPKVGTKHVLDNYEYSYSQGYGDGSWITHKMQCGWGVRIIDKTKTEFESPLTMIKGYPVTNMAHLFSCSKVTTLDLIDWNTSSVTDMSFMFESIAATSINGLSSFDTSNVTNMNGMFFCSNATMLNLSHFNTSNVTDMSKMFCSSQAISIDVSNFDTANVTTMYGMFRRNQSTNLGLRSFDTSKVTNMSYMFADSKVTSLDLINFDTSNTTTMNGMFQFCHITSLDLTKFNTSNVTNMSYMFDNSQLNMIMGLKNLDTSEVINMRAMFSNCLVTHLDLRNFNTSKVTNMNSMFSGSQATNLDLSSFDASNVIFTENMFKLSVSETVKVRTPADADKFRESADWRVIIL